MFRCLAMDVDTETHWAEGWAPSSAGIFDSRVRADRTRDGLGPRTPPIPIWIAAGWSSDPRGRENKELRGEDVVAMASYLVVCSALPIFAVLV